MNSATCQTNSLPYARCYLELNGQALQGRISTPSKRTQIYAIGNLIFCPENKLESENDF
jgi:hypothetical protein